MSDFVNFFSPPKPKPVVIQQTAPVAPSVAPNKQGSIGKTGKKRALFALKSTGARGVQGTANVGRRQLV